MGGRGPAQSAGTLENDSAGRKARTGQWEGGKQTVQSAVPTLTDVFDKKTYYNPGKIRSRLKSQLEKYERLLSESEGRLADLQMQLADPALASDYSKLMEIQETIDTEEKNQESLLERLLETETELAEMEE